MRSLLVPDFSDFFVGWANRCFLKQFCFILSGEIRQFMGNFASRWGFGACSQVGSWCGKGQLRIHLGLLRGRIGAFGTSVASGTLGRKTV